MPHRCTQASPAPDCPAVYVLRCRDGTLYTGATTDLSRRLAAHRRGRGAKYTRGRLPFKLLAWWHPRSYALAKSQEARFKRLARAAKLALVGGGEAFGCAIHTGAEPTRTS